MHLSGDWHVATNDPGADGAESNGGGKVQSPEEGETLLTQN